MLKSHVTTSSYLEYGRAVLVKEIAALDWLSRNIGDDFSHACEIIGNASGKVVVSGIGKAGIIARKISATLASTGSPSVWLDPVNALHGDLGMVCEGDVALLLSNSGSTTEVNECARVLRSMSVATIGMTKSKETPLARICDCVVAIGDHEEACALRLAPTSSTCAMLALGDAMAIALQCAKGFSYEDYARLHPSGALGRRLKLVTDCMRPADTVPVITLESTVCDAITGISECRTGIAVIVDHEFRTIGVFSDGDFRRLWKRNGRIRDMRIAEAKPDYSRFLKVCSTALVQDAIELMKTRELVSLPVVDAAGIHVGLLLQRDVV